MDVSTSACVVVPKPRDEVFEFCCRNDTFERHLGPKGPIAGVRTSVFPPGHSLTAGVHREITLTDGSVLDEVVLDYEPSSLHRYQWSEGLKGPFALLVRSGTGEWRFTDVSGGTRVEWSYDFALKSPLAYPLARPIMPIFRAWLVQSLESIRAELAS